MPKAARPRGLDGSEVKAQTKLFVVCHAEPLPLSQQVFHASFEVQIEFLSGSSEGATLRQAKTDFSIGGGVFALESTK